MSSLSQLLCRLDEGDSKALARLLSLIEAKRSYRLEIEKHIQTSGQKIEPLVIGITGLPGAGKSTIVDKLVAHYLNRNCRVGVIAIDPSSPSHGGALLGDRIRLMKHSTNPDVLIRSMASRGSLGGINSVTGEIARLMGYAGFDPIIIETVGMGQLGCDAAEFSNVLFAVSAPGLGDEIQLMKSGVLDLADALVLNKIDLPGAEQALSVFRGELEHRNVNLFKTNAVRGEGIENLAAFSDSRRNKKRNGTQGPSSFSSREIETLERIQNLIRPIALQFIRKASGAMEPQDLAQKFLQKLEGSSQEGKS